MVKPYIYVDITELERTALAVDAFLNDYRRKFRAMNDSMQSMRSSWVADDYTKFMQQWHAFYTGNSIGVGMIREFTSYKDYLDYAADQYRQCQRNALDRASRLK